MDTTSGPPPDVSQAVNANVHSSSPVNGGGPCVAQEFPLPQYQSPPYPVAATHPHVFAADDSDEYPGVSPTPTSRRSRGPMLSNLSHGSVNDDLAALGHQFLNQHTGTMSNISGLRTGSTTSNPLRGEASNLYGAANPHALGQWRADYGSMRPRGDYADTLGSSTTFSQKQNADGLADGWAYADGITSPTTTFAEHTSNERFKLDDLCHPLTGSSGHHPHYGRHHVAEFADSDLVMDNPSMTDRGQWGTQPLATQSSLTNTPPHLFAQNTPRKQHRLLQLSDVEGTLSYPYSGLSLSRPNPEEPVRFLTKNFSNPIVPQGRLMPVTSIDSPSTALPSMMPRGSDTSHPPVDGEEMCPYCPFVSRGKKPSDRKSNLNRHIRDKHERAEEAKPMCPEIGCGKTFERSDNVLRHRRKSHGFIPTTGDTSLREE